MRAKFFTEYEISGRNLSLLIKKLENSEVPINGMRYISPNAVRVKINSCDCDKFEKVCLPCHKAKKVAVVGTGAKIRYLLVKTGTLLGIILFLIGCYFTDGYLLDVKIMGSEEFYSDVYGVLEDEGIKKYSKFSDFDSRELEKKIYSANPLICYTSIKKYGTTLCVRVEKSFLPAKKIDTNLSELICDCEGEV